ncbi:unnamed protein product, partial [Tuber aestivum]
GVACVVRGALGSGLPRALQAAFLKIVQRETEDLGRQLKPREIQTLYEAEYHL